MDLVNKNENPLKLRPCSGAIVITYGNRTQSGLTVARYGEETSNGNEL